MIAALRAAETEPERSGGAGRKGGGGEMNARPALALKAAAIQASKAGTPPQNLYYSFCSNNLLIVFGQSSSGLSVKRAVAS
jgi:hypothetical protein